MNSSGVDAKTLVLQGTDIVELIGQTVALKRAGRAFKGLCPFHSEKSSSFQVSPDKQYFYCFGCKAHGNAIDFVMKRDRLEFVEAMKLLAERAGIELPKFRGSGESSGERQQLFEAQSAAGSYFQSLLKLPAGQAARDYLDKRGFNADTIQRFGIGVALDSWDGLLRSPLMAKFPPELLCKAGLLKQRDEGGGYYDTFRDRLMFPIRDEQGRVVAFGGRAMPGSDSPAKYLNSPETPIFSKSKCCYGLDLGRQRVVETRSVVITEGYTDTAMCHQFGVSNVVSVLGTALTGQHVSLLRRYADRIVLLFDPDLAGEMAVDRAVELFLTQPIEILIATLPEQLDPDEYLLKHGAKAFEEVIAQAQDALSHKWKQLEKQYKATEGDLTGQQKAVEGYLQTLAKARGSGPVDSLRWGSALTRVSRLTGIEVEELNRRFRAWKTHAPKGMRAPVNESAGDGSGGEGEEIVEAPVAMPRGPKTAQVRAERQVLGALLATPGWWHEVQKDVLLDDFCEADNHRLAEVYWDYQRNEGEPQFAEFLVVLKGLKLSELAIELLQEAEAFADIAVLIRDGVSYLKSAREMREFAKLRAQSMRKIGDEDSLELLKKFTERAKGPDNRRGW